MSKIGKKPIKIKEGVSVSLEKELVYVHGPLGEIKISLPKNIKVNAGEGIVRVERLSDDLQAKANHGTIARLIINAIEGASTGFSKVLEIVGTGYRVQMDGEILNLSLGFSHPVKYTPPPEIKIEVQENTKIKISGANKELVGLVADKVRRFRPPDPYKGKGIRYLGEKLRLKPGKAVAKAGVTVSIGGK